MKKLVIILLFLMIPSTALATAQFGEILWFNNEKWRMYTEPLEYYFDETHKRPDFEVTCTACWRGYIGTWKIDNSTLFLTKLQEGTCSKEAPEIPLSKVFKDVEGPVPAVWYSGIIRLPMGKTLEYIHMGFASIYEKDWLLKIENGKLVGQKLIDNTKKSPAELEQYQQMNLRQIYDAN